MKKVKVWMLFLLFCVSLSVAMGVSAEEPSVYDQADLLSFEEEQLLQERILRMQDVWEMNFLVVTTDDTEGKSSRDYADDYYDTIFPEASEEDGILYLIDMDNREIWLSTCGQAIRYLTDQRVSQVLDAAYNDVSEGEYYETFFTFLDETEYYLNQGILQDQYNYDTETGEEDAYYDSYEKPKQISTGEFVIALLAALAAAGGVCVFITCKYQLKFEDFHYNAHTDSDVRLYVNESRLINSFVTHRRIPRNNEGSGRSSGGSRSSTHRSSGGRSHGGGGRGF